MKRAPTLTLPRKDAGGEDARFTIKRTGKGEGESPSPFDSIHSVGRRWA